MDKAPYSPRRSNSGKGMAGLGKGIADSETDIEGPATGIADTGTAASIFRSWSSPSMPGAKLGPSCCQTRS